MPGTGGVPGDAVTLRAENARLRMLLEDKDAQIAALKTQNAELAERVARLERLISRNSGFSELRVRGGLTGWRLVPSAGVSDRVEDEVDVGLVESGDDVSQGDG